MAKSRRTTKKRKAIAAAPSAGEDPRAFIEKVREEKAAELEKKNGGRRRQGSSDDLDVDHLTRLISALISTNEEIWQRCKDSRMKADNLNFYKRVMFRYVQVSTPTGGRLAFKAISSFEVTSDFYLPSITDLPDKLTSIFAVSPREDDPKLPDYEKLFKSAVLLQDDVLLPLLKAFKEHLEDVQVQLGTIEEWLVVSKSCESFLKETFEDVIIPEQKINGCPSGCNTCHSNSDPCIQCGKTHSFHSRVRTGYPSYNTPAGRHFCPGDTSSSANGSFFKSDIVPLKTVHSSTCSHEEQFDLTNEEARDKLKKFLDYVS